MTGNHQCPKCLKAFCSPSKLQRHYLIHTGQRPYSCAVCLKSFTQMIHLKSHLKITGKCSQSLCNNSESHSSIPQPSNPGKSSVELELKCKIRVNAEQDLKTEIMPDADIKPAQQLNTSSSSFQEREEQFMTEKDVKPFQCKLCSRSFQLEGNLARHHKIHRDQRQLGRKSVQSSICRQMPGSEALELFCEPTQADCTELDVAVKRDNWSETCSNYVPWQFMKSVGQQRDIHTTSKQQRSRSHQCRACCKCFPSVSKLHRHMMTHTGERPFSCETCGKRFRQKTHLRVHCRTHLWSRYHKQRSLYINRPPSRVGGHCKTSADVLLQELVLHNKEVGTQAYTDGIAVKHLDQISSVDIIQNNDKRQPKNKLLPHTSKNTEVLLMSKASRATLTWRHAVKSRQHRCLLCLKCFPCPSKLKRHEMVHAGVKPFKCPACGKAFGQASHLKVHERTHSMMKAPLPLDNQSYMENLPPYPTISSSGPLQKTFDNMNSARLDCDGAVTNGETVLSCTRSKISVTKCFKSNITVTTWKQSKLHSCQICSKDFQTPYKLSRHSLTHSGIRPYKCSVCSKAFTQRGHLKVHEHRCRQVRISASDCTHSEMTNTTHTQDICLKRLRGSTGVDADATGAEQQSHSSHCSFSEEDSKWPVAPEMCLEEGNKESGQEQRVNWKKAADCFSSPSALAREMNNLVQSQQASSTLSHVCDRSAGNVERQDGTVTASSDTEEHLDSVFETQMQADLSGDHWTKNRCDVCFKCFVSPSKLTRHYLVHTGQRPFECDVCGRAFTQASHARKHKRTHQ